MSAKRSVTCKHRHRQRGAVLMVMLVIMIIGIAAILVNSLTSSKINAARQEHTAAALAQAKDALIGFAITYADTHSNSVLGYLPCPDKAGGNPEGSAELSCDSKNISVIGRLPWATLDLSAFRDGDGECLWYAVSGTYKDNPKTGLMNWDTEGQFQIYSAQGTLLTQPDNQVVAVIFAPGATQSGQDRSGTSAPVCGGNYTVSNYLDNDTVHSINNSDVTTGKFIQGTSGNIINDQMLFITRQDIWNAVQKRSDFQGKLHLLTQRVTECLANYAHFNTSGGGGWGGGYGNGGWGYGGWGNGGWSNGSSNSSLPWPAPLWLSDYSDNAQYGDAANLYAGRIPYNVSTSQLSSPSSLSPILMTTTNCPNWASVDPWWNNWKDHLFYAVAKEFRPRNNTGQDCHWSNPCLSINGSGNYAAVVMLAGPRLSSQDRTDKSLVGQYLEGSNASNYPDTASGNKDYTTAPASSTFNDVLYCIKEDLSVIPCP